MDIVAADRPTCSSAPRRRHASSSASSCAAPSRRRTACPAQRPGRRPANRGAVASGRSLPRGGPSRDRRGRRRPAAAGDLLDAEVVVEDGQGTRRLPFQLAVEEPGWRMYLVSHFHYDPVWWNTQAAYTETWGATIQYRAAIPGARSGARQVAPRDGPARSRLQVRPRRARLPQAVLGRLSGGPRLRPTAPGRRPARVRGRHVQRAEHEPDERRIDDPQRDLRHRLPARRPGRRPGHRVAARRVRARPAVPRDHGRRRACPRARGLAGRSTNGVPTGSAAPAACPSPSWPPATTRGCSSRWSSTGSRPAGGPAHELHGRPLFGRLVDGRRADARGGRGRGPSPVHRARHDGRDQERHAAGRHRLHAAQQVGQRDPARLEQPLRLAEVHDGHPARILRRRARRAGRDGPPVLPADARHEPDLHRQGRLVHRHQADAAGRREHAPRAPRSSPRSRP